MDKNLIWQYTGVVIIILLLIGMMIWKMRRNRRRGRPASSCCGCSLSQSCNRTNPPKGAAPPADCHSGSANT